LERWAGRSRMNLKLPEEVLKIAFRYIDVGQGTIFQGK